MGLNPSKDVVGDIEIVIESLTSGVKGWPIYLSANFHEKVEKLLERMLHGRTSLTDDELGVFMADMRHDLTLERARPIISVIGSSVCKAVLMNNLLSADIPTSFRTQGFRVFLPTCSFSRDFIWLEAGNDMPLKGVRGDGGDAALADKISLSAALHDVMMRTSDVVIAGAEGCSWDSQEFVYALSQSPTGVRPFVVHYFDEAQTEEELLRMWTSTVLARYPGRLLYTAVGIPGGEYVEGRYFVADTSNLHHLYLAKEGSPAGMQHNPTTFALLRKLIRSSACLSPSPFIESFLAEMNASLRTYSVDVTTVELSYDIDILTTLADPSRLDKSPATDDKETTSSLTVPWEASNVRESDGKKEDMCPARLFLSGFRHKRPHAFFVGQRGFVSGSYDNFAPPFDVIDDGVGLNVIMDLEGVDPEDERTGSAEAFIDQQDCLVIKGHRNLTYRSYTCSEDGEFLPGRPREYNSHPPSGESVGETPRLSKVRVEDSERKCGQFSRVIELVTLRYSPEILAFSISDGIAQVLLKKRHRQSGQQLDATLPTSDTGG